MTEHRPSCHLLPGAGCTCGAEAIAELDEELRRVVRRWGDALIRERLGSLEPDAVLTPTDASTVDSDTLRRRIDVLQADLRAMTAARDALLEMPTTGLLASGPS